MQWFDILESVIFEGVTAVGIWYFTKNIVGFAVDCVLDFLRFASTWWTVNDSLIVSSTRRGVNMFAKTLIGSLCSVGVCLVLLIFFIFHMRHDYSVLHPIMIALPFHFLPPTVFTLFTSFCPHVSVHSQIQCVRSGKHKEQEEKHTLIITAPCR